MNAGVGQEARARCGREGGTRGTGVQGGGGGHARCGLRVECGGVDGVGCRGGGGKGRRRGGVRAGCRVEGGMRVWGWGWAVGVGCRGEGWIMDGGGWNVGKGGWGGWPGHGSGGGSLGCGWDGTLVGLRCA